MDDEPPDRYKFKDYKQEVTTLVKEIDGTFSLDPGWIGNILKKSQLYLSTLRVLKDYVCAKVVDESNLSDTSLRFVFPFLFS